MPLAAFGQCFFRAPSCIIAVLLMCSLRAVCQWALDSCQAYGSCSCKRTRPSLSSRFSSQGCREQLWVLPGLVEQQIVAEGDCGHLFEMKLELGDLVLFLLPSHPIDPKTRLVYPSQEVLIYELNKKRWEILIPTIIKKYLLHSKVGYLVFSIG